MKIDLAKLTKRAHITITVEPEDTDPIDSFGYDSDEENRRAAQDVRDLAERTEWGWCYVRIIASYKGFTGSDSLGGCSYQSEDDFRSDGYYTDMVTQAIDDLARTIESTSERLEAIASELAQ